MLKIHKILPFEILLNLKFFYFTFPLVIFNLNTKFFLETRLNLLFPEAF